MALRTLKDMVVVITGASAGIGKSLAEQLGAQGSRLVLAARRLERLEALNTALGGGHLCVQADVSIRSDCEHLIEQAFARFGRIDTLVCNAGYGIYRRFDQITPEQVRQLIATNVLGTTDCIHAALPRMLGQVPRDGWRGQIMVVSSAAAVRGVPYIGMYSGTKAAQLALADAMRVELKPQRIAVTSVHPGQTETEFGDVAAAAGKMHISDSPVSQSAGTVARKMLRAIEHPLPQVWPSRLTRFFVRFAATFPALGDRGLARYRDMVERRNPDTHAGG